MKQLFKKPVWNYLLSALFVYILTFGYYYLVSNGLGDKPFYLQMRRFVPCALVAVLPVYLIGYSLLSKYFLSHIFVGLSWIITYPTFYWLTYHSTVQFFSNHFDISFGLYGTAALIALHILLLKFLKNKSLVSITIAFFQTLLMALPVFQWIYFALYHSSVTEPGLMALYQTNPNEALEFIKTIGYQYLLAPVAIFCLLFYLFYKANKITGSIALQTWTNKKSLAFMLVIFLGAGYYSCSIFTSTRLLEHYGEVRDYFISARQYSVNHVKNFASLSVTPTKPLWKKPGTVILIIGESASRNFMSAYTKTENDTTPWLREKLTDKNSIVFKHAYTSWAQTVPSLERALTTKNQYNEIPFNQSISILDIAKKAGYTTSWFSNQGTVGDADTQVTLVAKTADHSKWTSQEMDKQQYDMALMDYLKQVDPTQNNFIVLHIMGSHDNYQNRYPPEFTKWGDPKIYDFPVNYDNSLAYTDYFLSQVYEYAKNNLNLEAMVYFSDHGANPNRIRYPDPIGFVSLRIPLFAYLSDDYRKTYPLTAATLTAHRDSYFTNDLIYDMMCGILNVTSPVYDSTNSLASPNYKWTRETLRTRLGQKKLTEDDSVD